MLGLKLALRSKSKSRHKYRAAGAPPCYFWSPHARSPHSGSAGSVRSTPGAMRTVPFIQPIRGWRFEAPLPLLSFEEFSELGESERTLRNTSVPSSMSTCSLRKPASSQAFVITLLKELLLHQARYRWDAGSLYPMSRWIWTTVIGTSSRFWAARSAAGAVYLPIAHLK